ncbi:MAG TPA: hypothetical protein VFW87_14930 [Pirellulales bacterium]|nr:hypothetical protein [Pirellulales bacterium]
MLFSRWGEVWAHRHDSIDLLRRARCGPTRDRLELITGFILLWGWATLCDAGRLLMAAIPCRSYLERVCAAARQVVSRILRPALVAVRRRRAVVQWLLGGRKPSVFAADTQTLLGGLSLGHDDLVFIPTIEPNEMLGLRLLFERSPAARQPTWHLLFRRNIYAGRDSEYAAEDESLRGLRNAFRRFQERLHGVRVYFYTDTDQLTEQYNRLGVVPFTTLPVPVDAAYRAGAADAGDNGTLEIAYAGDARPEKGYHHLPRLVQDVWHDCVANGKASFRIQSNFNTPHGEPAAIVARSQLAAFAPEKVRLLLAPLTSDDYRQLVVRSDLMLVLYHRDNYYARSSGVFVEALAAGIPVVAPAGSWMASELENEIHAYHRSLLQRPEIACTEVEGARQAWRTAGSRKDWRMADGLLNLSGSAARLCNLDVPPESKYLLVSFHNHSSTAGNSVRVTAHFSCSSERPRARAEAISGGHPARPASVLLRVPAGVDCVQLRLRGAFTDKAIPLGDLRFYFLRSPGELPRSAIGAIYAEPGEIADAVREVVQHHGHYRATAQAKSISWAAFHEPGHLVRRLLDRAGVASDSPIGTAQRRESVSAFPREMVA